MPWEVVEPDKIFRYEGRNIKAVVTRGEDSLYYPRCSGDSRYERWLDNLLVMMTSCGSPFDMVTTVQRFIEEKDGQDERK